MYLVTRGHVKIFLTHPAVRLSTKLRFHKTKIKYLNPISLKRQPVGVLMRSLQCLTPSLGCERCSSCLRHPDLCVEVSQPSGDPFERRMFEAI